MMKWKTLSKELNLLKIRVYCCKDSAKTIQNEVKEWKGGFLSMLLDTLGASLLGYILAGKGTNRAGRSDS